MLVSSLFRVSLWCRSIILVTGLTITLGRDRGDKGVTEPDLDDWEPGCKEVVTFELGGWESFEVGVSSAGLGDNLSLL